MIKKLNKTTSNVNREILLEFKQVGQKFLYCPEMELPESEDISSDY